MFSWRYFFFLPLSRRSFLFSQNWDLGYFFFFLGGGGIISLHTGQNALFSFLFFTFPSKFPSRLPFSSSFLSLHFFSEYITTPFYQYFSNICSCIFLRCKTFMLTPLLCIYGRLWAKVCCFYYANLLLMGR